MPGRKEDFSSSRHIAGLALRGPLHSQSLRRKKQNNRKKGTGAVSRETQSIAIEEKKRFLRRKHRGTASQEGSSQRPSMVQFKKGT